LVRQGNVKGYKLSGTKRHVWRFLRADLDAALLGDPVGRGIHSSILITNHQPKHPVNRRQIHTTKRRIEFNSVISGTSGNWNLFGFAPYSS
jgi:hypothetical protein